MALRPTADDPWLATTVLAFGQLCIALDARRRLVGVGVYDRNHDSMLVAVCGRDEYGVWQRGQNRRGNISRRRRRRARGAA